MGSRRALDLALIAGFLSLTFLLGVFPLKDADFHWHLRTGDLIRQSGSVPRVDFYTFTRAGTPWIDLHWLFQVGISLIYERGGVPALTLAKSLITCLAVFLLVTTRRREWPIWAVVCAWLPALLVLGGRMYIRPETLSLLYLSIFLAVIGRWERFPVLAWVLPPTQLLWVNSHGLFVLGPVVLLFGLIDAALRRESFPLGRRWWEIVAPAVLATGLACLANPYGIRGALYPLELARTMSNPIFSRNIAELTPIPLFIQKAGWWNLPLLLHLGTMALGALSFLIPLAWLLRVRLGEIGRGRRPDRTALPSPPRAPAEQRGKAAESPALKKRPKARGGSHPVAGWSLSPLRLLLFGTFSLLSLQATRNSHQFAAVVGTVTAWNFAQWVAARRALRERQHGPDPSPEGVRPRLFGLVALGVLTLGVGSGAFYEWAGEGRTIGWGEEPLWFPHDAARFAGSEGMPERFLSYHNAHASLFEYYHSPERPGGPGRTVFTDPRLEVAGVELFDRYLRLGQRITEDAPGWEAELESLGHPTILLDHLDNAGIGASLMASRRWRCVWFDPIAAVFVHERFSDVVNEHQVDFAARHFRPDPATQPHGPPALRAAAKGMRNYLNFLPPGRGDLRRPLVWLGLSYARRMVESDPGSLEGWKAMGQIELYRDPLTQPSPRFQQPFDPVQDLSLVRATYAFRRAFELQPRDFMTLIGLQQVFEARQMDEALLTILDSLVRLTPINQFQAVHQLRSEAARVQLQSQLGAPPNGVWKNVGELDRMVAGALERGRAETAASLLEAAFPPETSPWPLVDRAATLRLHLGQPAAARQWWQRASQVDQPAIRSARIAATYLVEGQFDDARTAYREAIQSDPKCFEARFGLAILEQDAGRANEAYEQALAAIESAPNELSRSAARGLAAAVSRFAARPPRTVP